MTQRRVPEASGGLDPNPDFIGSDDLVGFQGQPFGHSRGTGLFSGYIYNSNYYRSQYGGTPTKPLTNIYSVTFTFGYASSAFPGFYRRTGTSDKLGISVVFFNDPTTTVGTMAGWAVMDIDSPYRARSQYTPTLPTTLDSFQVTDPGTTTYGNVPGASLNNMYLYEGVMGNVYRAGQQAVFPAYEARVTLSIGVSDGGGSPLSISFADIGYGYRWEGYAKPVLRDKLL